MVGFTKCRAAAGLVLAALAVGTLSGEAAPARAAVTPSSAPASSTLKLVASDEFNGAAGAGVNWFAWNALEGAGGWGNAELQSYTSRASNLSMDGRGSLRIVARRETYTGRDGITAPWTSARILSKVPVQYGRIEARMWLPAGQGLWPALWTVGTDITSKGWPACGEIDIAESVNSLSAVSGTLHGPSSVAPYRWQLTGSTKPAGGIGNAWHTFAVDWRPGLVTWLYDGVPYRSIARADLPAGATWAFDKQHYVQLDLAVGGTWPGPPDATTPSTATMLVDYVRVYALP